MATYYWVGGSGTWDNASTANWSNASGGAIGFGPPLSGDTVIFDDNSGTGTCTTASGSVSSAITLNSTNLALKLGANHTNGGVFTFTKGALDLSGFTLSVSGSASSGTGIRSIAFGIGKIRTTGSGFAVWNYANLTNFSYTGTPTVELSAAAAAGNRTLNHGFQGGGSEATAVSFYVTAGTDNINANSALFVRTMDFTGFSGTVSNFATTIYGNLIIPATATLSAGTAVTTFGGTTGIQQITTNGKTLDYPLIKSAASTLQLQDNLTMGATRTFTLTAGTLDLTGNAGNWTLSTGLFASSNANVRSITFGTGKIVLTGNAASVWNCGDTTNFTFSGTSRVELTYSGSTGTRAIASGSTAFNGVESNSLNFYVTAGTDTVQIGGSASVTRVYRTLDFTGFSGTITPVLANIFGDLVIPSTATLSASASGWTFGATSGTKSITTSGKTFDFPLTFNGIGGTFAFQDALTQGSTRAFTITNGTVQLKNGVTSTVGAFATSGTNSKFLQSTLLGSQATLSQASGTVNASYLTIRDINATGGATWNAFTTNNNVNAGNNLGWDFSSQLGKYIYTIRKNKRILP